MKPLAVVCTLAFLLLTIGSADAAKRHKRPLCKPSNSKVLKHTKNVRILYVEHVADEDEYGTPATVYACFPARHRRVRLFDIESTTAWSPKIMRLSNRYFAVAATTEDIVCEKYAQPDCTSSYVAAFRLSNGKLRCSAPSPASALALTSNGWIAWLSGTTLSACDSAGPKTLDEGSIDAASVGAHATSIRWTRDGQPQSAVLR